jgi:PLP dependent protein
MAELIGGLRLERVRANLEEVHQEIAQAAARASRDPAQVEVLAATKYVPSRELEVLAAAGVKLVGENRAHDLLAKVAEHGSRFTWDFIGALQSRKVALIVPHVRLIHSVASESALAALGRRAALARADLGVLIEVNLAGEQSKAGVAPAELDRLIERSPVPVRGLMTMPPLARDPQASRRWFAALRQLADDRQLEHLSMGTSQDYAVAVEEGATIVRIGTRLYGAPPPDLPGG